MRGGDVRTEGLFSDVSCAARVPMAHPLRPIRGLVDAALEARSPEKQPVCIARAVALEPAVTPLAGEVGSRAVLAPGSALS